MPISLSWTPKVSVGPIKFGNSVTNYIESGHLVAIHTSTKDPDERSYRDTDDRIRVSLFTDNDDVEFVFAFKELTYKGTNIIGLDEGALLNLLKQQPDDRKKVYDSTDDRWEEMLQFDAFGLSVWMYDGIVDEAGVDEGNYA